MVKDLNLFFDDKTKEYLIVSDDGHSLRLNKADFSEIKKSMNGISYALLVKKKRRDSNKKKEMIISG